MQDLITRTRPSSRRPIGRRLLAVTTAVLVAGSMAACSKRADDTQTTASFAAVDGGTIVWAKQAETIALDPAFSSLGTSWELLSIVYDRLVGLDSTMQPVPALAESWDEVSPTQYRFHLRTDAMFSNGRAMDSADVVWSLERALDPAQGGGLAARTGAIESVVAEDPHTVLITLANPSPSLLGGLATIAASVAPSVEVKSGEVDLTKTMLGTGSFMVQAHQQDDSWTLVANPHAWRAPQAGTLEIKIMPDMNARIAALSDGSVDLATFDAPDASQLLSSTQNVEVDVQERPDFYMFTLNARSSGALADQRVRQALSYALDRGEIRDVALGGIGTPTGPVSVAFPDGLEPTLAYDPEKAKALLAEAGASGLTIEIIYNNEPFGAIAQVIQQQLQRVGVTVNLAKLEEGVLIDRMWNSNPSNMDAAVSWYAAFSSPTQVLGNYVPALSPWAAGFLPENDPAAVQQITNALTATPDQLAQALPAAAAAIDAQATAIPLVTKPTTIAYRVDLVEPVLAETDGLSSPLAQVDQFRSGHK